MNYSLWTCSKSLMPYSIQFINNYKFLLQPLPGPAFLLFFLSPTPWTARRSNQSILKEINPEYLFEGLMLKLKLQYFGHQMQRADSLEKILTLGKIESRRRGQKKIRWLDGITDSWVWANSGRLVKDREARHAVVIGVARSWTGLRDWTTTAILICCIYLQISK